MMSSICQVNAIEAVVLMMSIILLKPQCVKWSRGIRSAMLGTGIKGRDK